MFNNKYKGTMKLLNQEIEEYSDAVKYYQEKLYNEKHDNPIDAKNYYDLIMYNRYSLIALNKLRSKIILFETLKELK